MLWEEMLWERVLEVFLLQFLLELLAFGHLAPGVAIQLTWT